MRSEKAFRNILTNLVLQLVMVIYGFIVPRIIISYYGSSVNGLIASITQFLGYITLLESGFGPVVKSILYKPIAEKNKKEIKNILKSSEIFFRRIAMIFIIYIVGLSLLYPLLVKNDFDYIYTFSLIIIISISTFAQYYFGMTYQLYLQAKQKTYIVSLIQILSYILSIIIVIIIAIIGGTIQVLKLVSGIIFVLRPLLLNLYVKKKYNIKFGDTKDNYKIKNKLDGLVQHIAYVIHNNTDIAILTLFGTLVDVSIYSIYNMVISGIKSVIDAFSNGISASFGDMIARNEDENLNNKFGVYETIYLFIITIIYSCTLSLTIPFVELYTRGISDAEYIRPSFSVLIIISSLIFAIRSPYNELTKAAGHFKETRKGALIEAISNIVISIAMVKRYGIIGVALGTVVAMTIRTLDLVIHANKEILHRSISITLKKILLLAFLVVISSIIHNYVPVLKNTTYLNWICNAIICLSVTSIITVIFNLIFYKRDLLKILSILKIALLKKEDI